MPDEPITREDAATLAAKVYALVRACPPGRVTTYGWLGAAVGLPRGARLVGWFMNETPSRLEVPAHRVINSKGELTGSWAWGKRGKMQELLESEGIVFSAEGRVDMKRYGWHPESELTDEEREQIFAEAAKLETPVSDNTMHLLLDDPASPFRIVPNKD